MALILAESISIDGGLVAFVLAVLLVLVIATVALMIAGAVWARRAARGSEPALAGFLLVVAVEAVLATIGLASVGPLAIVFAAAFLVHVGLYAYERSRATGGASSDKDPPTAP